MAYWNQTSGYSPVYNSSLPLRGEAAKDKKKILEIRNRRIEKCAETLRKIREHKASGEPMNKQDQYEIDRVVLKAINDLDLPKSPDDVIGLCKSVIALGSVSKKTEKQCEQLMTRKGSAGRRSSTEEICRECVAGGQNNGCPNYCTKAFFRAMDIVDYQKQHYGEEER